MLFCPWAKISLLLVGFLDIGASESCFTSHHEFSLSHLRSVDMRKKIPNCGTSAFDDLSMRTSRKQSPSHHSIGATPPDNGPLNVRGKPKSAQNHASQEGLSLKSLRARNDDMNFTPASPAV